MSKKYITWNKHNLQKIKDRIARGENIKSIAPSLGLTSHGLRTTLRRHNIRTKNRACDVINLMQKERE